MMGRELLLALMALVCLPVLGQEASNIAVVELENKNVPSGEVSVLTDKLRGELIETGRFVVVERGQMENILREQGFQQSGCTSSECVVEAGQLIGVDRMVAGSVGRVGGIYLIALRLIDVEKGSVIRNVEVQIEGSIADVLNPGIRNAARKMADMKVEKFVPRKGIVPEEAYWARPPPWGFVAAASFLVPGTGQLMNRHYLRACLFAGAEGALVSVGSICVLRGTGNDDLLLRNLGWLIIGFAGVNHLASGIEAQKSWRKIHGKRRVSLHPYMERGSCGLRVDFRVRG